MPESTPRERLLMALEMADLGEQMVRSRIRREHPDLEEAGVRLWNCALLAEVRTGEVRVIRNVSRTVPDPRVTWEPLLPENVPNPFARKIRVEEREETLGADLVVLAAGAKADDGLYRECLGTFATPTVRNVGDSHIPGRVLEAVRSGYAAGISV